MRERWGEALDPKVWVVPIPLGQGTSRRICEGASERSGRQGGAVVRWSIMSSRC